MVDVKYSDKTVSIPEEFEELTHKQYRFYLYLSMLLLQRMISKKEFEVRWMSFLLDMKLPYTQYQDEIIAQLDKQRHCLKGFFYDVKQPDGSILQNPILETGKNLMPEFSGWKGVGDMLNGLSFAKFVECLNRLALINEAETNEEISDLMAEVGRMLYSHPDAKADMPTMLAFHAVTLFANVWKMIRTTPIHINGEDIDFSILFKSSSGRHLDDKTGWAGIAFEVAASGVFGTMKEVDECHFWDILLYLYKCKFAQIHN